MPSFTLTTEQFAHLPDDADALPSEENGDDLSEKDGPLEALTFKGNDRRLHHGWTVRAGCAYRSSPRGHSNAEDREIAPDFTDPAAFPKVCPE